MLPEIRAAKQIKYKIGHKADVGCGDDDNFELETGFIVNASGTDETTEENNTAELSAESRHPVARSPSPAASMLSVVSSRVPRKSRDSAQDFLSMMRMQMMFDREERRERQKKEDKQHDHLTGLVTALVGGLTAAFGIEPPQKKMKKTGSTINVDNSSIESEE